MKVFAENDSRKIDSLGRVTIPKGMRNRWGLREGDEMWFFTILDRDGTEYIALTNRAGVDPKYEAAAKVLIELGLEVPEKLEKMYAEED